MYVGLSLYNLRGACVAGCGLELEFGQQGYSQSLSGGYVNPVFFKE